MKQTDDIYTCDAPGCPCAHQGVQEVPSLIPDGWAEITIRIARADRKGYRSETGHVCSSECAGAFYAWADTRARTRDDSIPAAPMIAVPVAE